MLVPKTTPFNPYAAPQPREGEGYAPASPVRPPRALLKWIYGGLSGIMVVLLLLTHVVEYSDETAFLWKLIERVDGPFALVRILLALLWIHAAWTDVPAAIRTDANVTPGRAVGLLFVPFYNFYWIVAMPLKLCAAMDRALLHAGRSPSAPSRLALMAALLNLLHAVLAKTSTGMPVLLSFAATNALWFLFMLKCDGARADIRQGVNEA